MTPRIGAGRISKKKGAYRMIRGDDLTFTSAPANATPARMTSPPRDSTARKGRKTTSPTGSKEIDVAISPTTGDCKRRPRCRRSKGAFTLIELILVMALLAIILAVSAPSLSRFFKGRGLESEAQRFMALTRHAQSRAVSEGVPMVLWLETKQRLYGLNAEKSFIENDPRAEQFN